ncbi:hypoxanthine phosphoribosyltransferase [Proteinivorax hydrogeniformans]|uniref:Hypoxanthine phosphoribosyltransferase n=1 Tax=Proteinivorax hydrogeniformans TaxID=1826727 RepID=A0AAU8HTS7_9FIRM
MVDGVVDKVLFSEKDLAEKVSELGKQIAEDYKDKDLLLVCVLKGGILFMSDLSKKIDIPLKMDFIAVSSYGDSTTTSGVVQILKDLDTSIEGKHVLIVEDIIDSGLTLKYLLGNLKTRKPASLKVCTLLDKPERRTVDLKPDYCGFSIENHFVVGYGLDFMQMFRNVPYIFIPKQEYVENMQSS